MDTSLLTRLIILCSLGVFVCLLVIGGRLFVASRRKQGLAAEFIRPTMSHEARQPIQILAFTSKTCRQCHQLQTPAIERVREACPEAIAVTEIDATSEQTLTRLYKILTVPSTVILDHTGKAQAINYGFANTERLLQQINALQPAAS